MPPERRTRAPDLVQRCADVLGDHQACALRVGAVLARVTSDSRRRRQLGIELIQLFTSARHATDSIEMLRLIVSASSSVGYCLSLVNISSSSPRALTSPSPTSWLKRLPCLYHRRNRARPSRSAFHLRCPGVRNRLRYCKSPLARASYPSTRRW